MTFCILAGGDEEYDQPAYDEDERCPGAHGHGCLDPDCDCECHEEFG